MHPFKNFLIFTLAIGHLLFFSACTEEEDTAPVTPEDPTTEDPTGVDVQLTTDGTFGSYLTDAEGRTLYFFTNDADGTSTCVGGCEAAWPVFNADSLTVSEGLAAADFGSITRADGSKQTTFKGWPLYRFASDANAGDITGDGSGGVWFVAKPDYSLMLANQDIETIDGDNDRYLVDAEGNTLYFFLNDEEGISNCEGGCLASWPSFAGSTTLVLPSALSADTFGSITGTDGQPQRTYRGRPMYFFAQDQQRGDVIGEGASDVWFVFNGANLEKAGDVVDVPEEEAEAVELADSDEFGSYLVDSEGRTLYFFARDANGTSVCAGGCEAAWPTFHAEDLAIGEGLAAADFATITRPDGSEQTTYKGWPLYYFASDENAGDINGDGSGNVWFVAKPDYSIMVANQDIETIEGDSDRYLVDAQGNTLYFFLNDEENVSNCAGGCLASWPSFAGDDNVVLPSILASEDFGSITGTDGEPQMTYKGRPMYYFAQDQQRGDVIGEGASDVWFVFNENHLEEEGEVPVEGYQLSLANNDALGNYLVDAEGKTLYYYTKDASGESVCEGACEAAWPVFYQPEISYGKGLVAADFAEITRPDGSKQVTYQGWPLYYYAGDAPGDIIGEGIGTVWFAAKPNYTLMVADAVPEGADASVKYLVDAYGNTLYYALNDEENVSNCNGDCAYTWPAFAAEGALVLPSALDEADFATIQRSGGGSQLTYVGRPLYYFVQDAERGATQGHASAAFTVAEVPSSSL